MRMWSFYTILLLFHPVLVDVIPLFSVKINTLKLLNEALSLDWSYVGAGMGRGISGI